MSRQQEVICGLSRVVTIAVLPRLNMEELIFELNRRIQNLDKENSIKDRLVSILRDVMLEEYRQLETRSISEEGYQSIVPGQTYETVTTQENVPAAYAKTMSTKTSSPETSLESSGLDIVMKKERNDESSEVLMHTNELEFNTDQEQLCNIPSSSSATLPLPENPLMQMKAPVNPRTERKGFSDTKDKTASYKACHDEISMDTPYFGTQLLDTGRYHSMSDSSTEKPSASREPTPDHSDVRRWECHVSDNDQIGHISQPANLNRYSDDRETGFINNGQEQSGNKEWEETYVAPSQPTSVQACDNTASLLTDDDSRNDYRRYMCDKCDYRTAYTTNLARHMRRHTGEKPYSCQECDYRASEKGTLVRHMRRRHQRK